jgi:DNA topoisomerase-1
LDNGDEITVSKGRFGPYLRAGEATVSLAPPISPYTITEAEAKQLMVEGIAKKAARATPLKELGVDPETGKAVTIKDGRFGPYVTDGITHASLGKKRTVEEVDLPMALEMLAKKRAAPKRNWGKKKEQSFE